MWELFQSISPGSNVQIAMETEECLVLKALDESGEGSMTLYQIWDGVYLMYNDFHMKKCVSQFQAVDSFFCVEHCREGRIEQQAERESLFYMEAGDLRIDRRVHHAGHFFFPLCHYRGMTIGFERSRAERSIKKAMPEFDVDFGGLAEKFCDDKKPFVLHKEPAVEHIFSELYQVPAKIRKDYFKIKVMELLIYLEALEPSRYRETRPYFFVGQVEKVKAIQQLLTADLTKEYTIEELAGRFDMSPTSMKNCFKSVYGSPIYTYMRLYRMNQAASLLVTHPEMKVSDVAYAVGYESPSKFSAAFGETMGMTPLKYRKARNAAHQDSKVEF